MPESSYAVRIQATAPSDNFDIDVVTATVTLTTRRPLSEREIEGEALAKVAERAGRPASDYDVIAFTYTTMPTA